MSREDDLLDLMKRELNPMSEREKPESKLRSVFREIMVEAVGEEAQQPQHGFVMEQAGRGKLEKAGWTMEPVSNLWRGPAGIRILYKLGQMSLWQALEMLEGEPLLTDGGWLIERWMDGTLRAKHSALCEDYEIGQAVEVEKVRLGQIRMDQLQAER